MGKQTSKVKTNRCGTTLQGMTDQKCEEGKGRVREVEMEGKDG